MFDIWLGWTHEPNHAEDITGFFARKVDALAKHASQLEEGIRFFEDFLGEGRGGGGGEDRRRARRGVPRPRPQLGLAQPLTTSAPRMPDVAPNLQVNVSNPEAGKTTSTSSCARTPQLRSNPLTRHAEVMSSDALVLELDGDGGSGRAFQDRWPEVVLVHLHLDRSPVHHSAGPMEIDSVSVDHDVVRLQLLGLQAAATHPADPVPRVAAPIAGFRPARESLGTEQGGCEPESREG